MIIKFFNKRFDKWLARRMPATKKVTLSSANLFIFPSKAGLHFLATCFILFLLGTNYQNNLILFIVFFLCSFMITSLLLSFHNMSKITLSAMDTEAQFAGDNCLFRFRLSAGKSLPHDLHFKFQSAPSNLQPVIEGNTLLLFAPADKRGYFKPGRITLQSAFPFGLYRVWTHIDFGSEVLIYPQPIENKMQLISAAVNSGEQQFNQTLHGGDQFSTLKAYQPGESLKSVAWKQLAQGRGWLSKQFDQSVGGNYVLDFSELNHLPLEMHLSYLCYHITELEKRHQHYALILPDQTIPTSTGEAHQHRCLKALALYKLTSHQ